LEQSATISKLAELHSATVLKVIYPHSGPFSKVLNHDSILLVMAIIIAVLSFVAVFFDKYILRRLKIT
jgi:hypothetical protein